MSVLTIILLVIIGGMLAVLLPRLRLICSFGNGESLIEVNLFWFSIAIDLRTSSASGRILFFRFRKVGSEETIDEPVILKQTPVKDNKVKTENDSPYPDHSFDKDESYEPHPTPKIRIKNTRSKPRKEKSTPKEKKPPMWRQVWRERNLMWRLIQYLVTVSKRLLSAFQIDYFRSHVTLASSDPALTGMLYGYVVPLTCFNNLPRRSITFDTDFDTETPDGEVACSISIRPIYVLHILIIETLRLPWLQIIRVVRQFKQKQ